MARELSRTGAYVLALDFQGAGESEGVTSFQGRIDDYVAAMDFLQAALGVTRFGLGGHSGGGAYPAACAAVVDARVSALVLWDCMFDMYDAHVAPGCLDPGGDPAAGVEETLERSRSLPAALVPDEALPSRGVEGRLDAMYEEVEATLARFRHPSRLLGDVQQRREVAVLHVVAEELVRQLGPTPRGRTYTLPEVPASPARARFLGRPLRFQESGLFADRYRRWHDELREPKRLVVVPGTDHAFAHPGRGEALRESVRWVQERLVGDDGQADTFLAVHFEPRSADARGFDALRELVRLADDHRVPLTLQLTPSWARLILSDPGRLAALRDWQARGHEVAAHHHGARHGWEWDGYTNLPEAEWRQARDRARATASPEARRVQEQVAQAGLGERYLGSAEDAIDLLRRLAGPWPVQTMTMGPDRDADWPTGVPFSLDNVVVAPDGSYTIRGEATTRPEARTYRGQPVVELSMRFVSDLAGVELAMAEHAGATGDDVVGFVTHIEDFAGDPRPVRAWLEHLSRRDPDGRYARTAAAILGRRR